MKKLSAPATQAEKDRYRAACEKVELQPPDVIRKLVECFADHVEQHGYVVWPLKFAPPPASQTKARR